VNNNGTTGLKIWHDLRKAPRELWILCLARFVNRVGAMALPFMVLYLTVKLGFSAERAAFVLALYGIVSLLAGPLSGRLADRWGGVRVMQVSLVTSGFVLLFFPLAKSWPAVLTMTALLSLTSEAFGPASLAIVSEFGTDALGKSAFSIMRFASNLGMSVGPAVGGFLAQVSFTALFAADGLTNLVAAAIVIGGVSTSYMVKKTAKLKSGLLDAFRHDRDLRVFLLGIIPSAMVFSQISGALPLFMVRNLKLSESAYGLLFTLNTLMIVTMEIPLSRRTSHWPHKRSMGLGSVLIGLGFGSLAFATGYPTVLMTVVIWTLGEMMLFPSMAAYTSDLAPEGQTGEYMGLYTMSFNLAFRLVGPWAGVIILERLGPTSLWLTMLAAGMISALILTRRIKGTAGRSPARSERESTLHN
jgi:MFS family permease